jgi:hypothetical protein
VSTMASDLDSRRWLRWIRALALAVFMPCWAFGLIWLGAAFTGAGHGDYVLLNIPVSPLNFWDSGFSFFFALLMWGLIGFFTLSPTRWSNYPAVALLAGHYAGVAALVFGRDRGGLETLLYHLKKYPDMQGLAWLWLLAYGTVNLLLWGVLIFRVIRLRSQDDKVAQKAKDTSEAHV